MYTLYIVQNKYFDAKNETGQFLSSLFVGDIPIFIVMQEASDALSKLR